MATFVMCIGVAGSGKSTYCDDYLTEYYDAVYLSSDILRETLYGDANDQTHNREVFRTMNELTQNVLELDTNVVYDATNLSRARRKRLLSELPECERVCYWFDTPFYECVERDAHRSRSVGEDVIRKMTMKLEVPIYEEGWNKIYILRGNDNV